MNMHESHVSFEVAKLLEEAGFDWECRYVYKNDITENKNIFEYTKGYWKNQKDILLSAPTLAEA